ncbi:survival motor neuron protein isoform X1 [Papilio machaon]|uniref:survival motor neuron protein isoform X1 n=1 Tax=Papilio machaon TaxID=76193 RepID=UPI001E6639B2|nr:survival motor neuron protein isoform X1 [Papilio machaon]
MSNGELLYVKGMNLVSKNNSETEDENVEEDIWDDRKLNDAYDKALKIANAEVAKRVAMSTNTQNLVKNPQKDKTTSKNETSSQKLNGSQRKSVKWQAGMPCRAIYEVDGQEYEAFVLRLINDKECIVKFLGYDNSEIVSLSSLKPTQGKHERMRQTQQALCDNDDGFGSQPLFENMDCSDAGTSLGSTDGSFQKKKKSLNKKKNQRKMNLPDIPMFNPAMLGNLNSMDMPLPPPPPIGFGSEHSSSEDQALSSMLLSWYMSGYYTGLYQGMKR